MNKNQQEFKDFDRNGKDRKWQERKKSNIYLGRRLEILEYKTFDNVLHCAEVLNFLIDKDEKLKLYQTWFCKNKLCPICNWRRSMKYSYQAMQIVEKAIEREPKGRFLFLTLTIKNVSGNELNKTLSDMTKSFKRLFERKKVKKNLIGFLRATEVTRNDETEMYHPHLHILLFVKSSYFKGDGENYISQKEWQELWKQSAKLNYDPVVDIRVVKPNEKKGTSDIRSAVLETAKYPVKSIDEMGKTEEEKLQVTDDLMQGLYRKRQIAFGGLFKKIRKELQLSDIENGDLINTSDEQEVATRGEEIVARWNWQRQNYYIEN